jgi:UDP-3-O-acyl-N-acetylglucosamine deacetylase
MAAPDILIPRRTLSRPVEVSGVGLFTAAPAVVRIEPSPPGCGIRFRRDSAEGGELPARIEYLASESAGHARNTVLQHGRFTVMTVEHILSALAGMGITDALIDISGPEIPIGDGSAMPFVKGILEAGFQTSTGEGIHAIEIVREIKVCTEKAVIIARPRDEPGARYRYELDYGPDAPIGPQSAELDILPFEWTLPHGIGSFRDYAVQVSPSRTFCLESEAIAMRAAGQFRHVTPREMLVIGARGPIDNAMRFENEPARHKLLDLIGDLALVGRPIQGEIIANRAGHVLNHRMVRALLDAFA